jgi:hypothetical protein
MNWKLAMAAITAAAVLPLVSAMADPSHHPASKDQMMQGPSDTGGMMQGDGMMSRGGMMDCPMHGMMSRQSPRIEGRLAFLKAELGIKKDQEKAWNDYAKAFRSSHQNMMTRMDMMGGAMGKQGEQTQAASAKSAVNALQGRIRMMESMVQSLKALEAPTSKLYDALDETQRATADDLLGMSCGMMRM